ncbi:sigma-54 interaction domain-containing protein [Vreelandella neptunia]|uniref:Sigma-54 dependent transcriptional regulator n=1 Tax=Vreelandella neptunia TaxID=115551 RepID=A0ABZ0YK18_9GAMM|nr:sigma-54 dependent transcriptional regulator [Halomonas neptunia]MDN3560900.1 sigma-54 dependent transcriptional regulator [Halomonas neptunia]WQH11884.1 sigma-54 dependent transcriptional regulator [Halomonas neptunia]
MQVKALDQRSASDAQPLAGLAAMPMALALVESTTPRELRLRSRQLLGNSLGLAWVECLYLDSSGRWVGRDNSEARFNCDEFSHPYAHAIRTGKPVTLGVGEARTRLDHPGFQAQIASLSGDLRLHVRPLRLQDSSREWLGVLAFVTEAATLTKLMECSDFVAFEALLCRLWSRLASSQGERQKSAVLRDSLAKLNDNTRRQGLAAKLASDLLGNSIAMQELRQQVIRAAETNLAVLLQGETGTGKDVVARAIHRFSARAKAPFMAINCAAIPESLLESELFGHSKGAFSGADQAREGLIAQADGGTLFLDEIGDMPLALQAKLLRVLESGRYRPLGSNEERCADLRLIAATHQPLREQIKQQRFRADLYYRLGQFPLSLPSLSARREDIAFLAEHFVADFCAREERSEMGITPAALRQLKERDYPGNVRELKNLIDYACAMTPAGGDIEALLLPSDTASGADSATPETSATLSKIHDLRQAVRDYEAQLISQRLLYYGGNRALAAESLGIPKRTLSHKCQLLELDAK